MGNRMRLALVGSQVTLSLALSSIAFGQEVPVPPPPPPPPPSAPAPAPPPPPPPPHVDRVSVTVESTKPEKNVVVERRIKTDEMYGRTLFVVPQHSEVQTWEQVCVAPCKVDLDRASTYRVGRENGVTTSGQFTLPPGGESVKLEVQPGSFWWHAIATQFIALGTASGIVGGALITTASTWDDKKDEKHVRTAGIITSAIGIVLVGVGIPLAILTQTHVRANDKRVSAAPPPPRLTVNGLVF